MIPRTISTILLAVSLLQAQTVIYRSIQPGNSSAIAIGTGNNLTISGSTATFASAIPDTIGIGCVIQYDANGDGIVDNLAFIHDRTSSTVFTIKDSLGANSNAVTNDQDWSIFHAYTSLNNCQAGTENTGIAAALRNFSTGDRNLSTANEQWNIICYRGADTQVSDWAGWTTGASQYIKVYTPYLPNEVGKRQRHQGIWTISAYRMELSSGGSGTYGILLGTGSPLHFRVDGLQFWNKAGASSASGGITCGVNSPGQWYISNCIFRGASGGTTNGDWHAGIRTTGPSTMVARIWNNIVYDYITPTSDNDRGIFCQAGVSANTIYVYNNTVYNCARGIWDDGANVTVVAKNNICKSNTTDFQNVSASGTDYNASGDATASTGSHSRINQTFIFVSAGADFHLQITDQGAKGFGVNLSGDANLAFGSDIDIGQRSPWQNWDIGADQVSTILSLMIGRRLISGQ